MKKASAIVTNKVGVPAMQQLLHGRLVFQRSLVAAMLQMFEDWSEERFLVLKGKKDAFAGLLPYRSKRVAAGELAPHSHQNSYECR